MYSFLMAENRTDLPAITVCGADGVIFPDIPAGHSTGFKRVDAGSLRLEIYDNRMKKITVFWLPMRPASRARVCIFPDYVTFTLLQ